MSFASKSNERFQETNNKVTRELKEIERYGSLSEGMFNKKAEE